MNRLFIALIACCGLAASGWAAEPFDVQRLAWLEGVWIGEDGDVAMEEHWTSAAGGALLGVHRDVRAGHMVSFEFMRIQSTPDGTFFFASPRSAPPTAFKLVRAGNRDVMFENPAHDFPQRIRYWLDASGMLHARIEGTMNGKNASEEWTWRKRESVSSR